MDKYFHAVIEVTSLALGRFQFNARQVIFKLNLVNGGWGISGAVRQQVITWANVNPDLCRQMASLGLGELIHVEIVIGCGLTGLISYHMINNKRFWQEDVIISRDVLVWADVELKITVNASQLRIHKML